MNALEKKSDLETEKTAAENNAAVLQTPSGAATFLADTRKALQSCLRSMPKVPGKPHQISMTELIQLQLNRLDQCPQRVVNEEISKLKRNALRCTAQIKAIDRTEIKPVQPIDPLEKERI
jgi:hypothetical protein